MFVSESNYLRDNFFKLNRELYDKSLRLNFYLDQEEWSVFYYVEEVLAIVVVCLMSGYYDCSIVIIVNVDKFENCLMSLTLSIQSLQKYVMFEKV